LKEPENQEDLSFSELLFFKQKPGSKRKGTTESPSVAKKKQTPAKKSKKAQDQNTGYFAFLTESQTEITISLKD